jgi:branched-chain amino acid transport system ATP-binding protein
MILEVQSLSAQLDGVEILRDMTFEAEDGTITAIVGPNGAGKTTTLRTIMGLIKPTSGWARYDGQDLEDIPTHERTRMGIGYTPEDRGLIPDLTARENIEMPLWGTTESISRDEKDNLVGEMVEFFPEMEEFLDRPAGHLSGGQQQMVSVARALVIKPKLLLLDEPFEGLAPTIRTKLKTRLAEKLDDSVSILISESEINHIADFAERIHVIDRGEILAEGLTYDELIARDDLMANLGG